MSTLDVAFQKKYLSDTCSLPINVQNHYNAPNERSNMESWLSVLRPIYLGFLSHPFFYLIFSLAVMGIHASLFRAPSFMQMYNSSQFLNARIGGLTQ